MSKNKKNVKVKSPIPPPVSRNNLWNIVSRYILPCAFFIFAAIITTVKFYLDDDVFWHLATGRYITETFTIPSADVFGFVTAGSKWIPFEWGWDVITYFLFNVSGYTGISILRSLLIIAMFLFLIRSLRIFKIQYSIVFLYLALISLSILGRLAPRPQLITYFALAALIYILYLYNANKEKHKPLYFIPVIFLFWANMHMGVLYGLAVFFIYIVSLYAKNYLSEKKLYVPSILLKIFAFTVIALLINPHLWDTYIYSIQHSQMQMLESINEWKSPLDPAFSSNYNIIIYFIILFFGISTFIYARKEKEYFPLLVFLFSAYMSLQSMRFITEFMIVTTVPVLISFNELFKNKFETSSNTVMRTVFPVLAVTVILTLSYLCYTDVLYKKIIGTTNRETGFGINEDFYPVKLFDFMKSSGLDKIIDKPFNNMRAGGFLIWNEKNIKNFIDSRNLSDNIYSEYKLIDTKQPGFEKKLNDYGIDCVIYSTPFVSVDAREIERTLLIYLFKSPDWKLVYWDDISFLFVKNTDKLKTFADKYSYDYVNPYNIAFQPSVMQGMYNSDMKKFKDEYLRKANEEPNGAFVKGLKRMFRF